MSGSFCVSWSQFAPVFEWAIADINSNSTLLSGYTLNGTVSDTQSDKFLGYSASDTLVENGVVAIVGAVSKNACRPCTAW